MAKNHKKWHFAIFLSPVRLPFRHTGKRLPNAQRHAATLAKVPGGRKQPVRGRDRAGGSIQFSYRIHFPCLISYITPILQQSISFRCLFFVDMTLICGRLAPSCKISETAGNSRN
jgi:hypothetical protein